MIIAIDFDGTIVKHRYPKIGKIKKNAKEVINYLFEKGHVIIIWTCRFEEEDIQEMKNFLDREGINYNYINENDKKYNFFKGKKIYADIYIDDRSITKLPKWKKILKIINSLFV